MLNNKFINIYEIFQDLKILLDNMLKLNKNYYDIMEQSLITLEERASKAKTPEDIASVMDQITHIIAAAGYYKGKADLLAELKEFIVGVDTFQDAKTIN